MSFCIAICVNAEVFLKNKIIDPAVAKDYPGALWVSKLNKKNINNISNIITGDVALKDIKSGLLNPSKVLVIQEDTSKYSNELISLGAKPFILLCGESPLYAKKFYYLLPEISKKFDHVILFRGYIKNASGHIFYFPSFSEERINIIKNWESRKFSVMVASNKYWKINLRSFRNFLTIIRNIFTRRSYLSQSYIKKNQLIDERLKLIEFFGKNNIFDLFGSGWDNLRNLPECWENRLELVIEKISPIVCKNKIETISNYKFSFCVENFVFPGYITEKILDSLVAGVIPVYFGAPDISDFIPPDIFIDARKYSNYEELKDSMLALTQDEALLMIEKGQDFLKSEQGLFYSYEKFARRIEEFISERAL